jgi:hypothetical protein
VHDLVNQAGKIVISSEGVKDWLDSVDIAFTEGPLNLNWTTIMKTVVSEHSHHHQIRCLPQNSRLQLLAPNRTTRKPTPLPHHALEEKAKRKDKETDHGDNDRGIKRKR